MAFTVFLAGLAGILLPATYGTFDTNLGRYLWPFIPMAAMAAVMGAVVLGRGANRLRPGLRSAPVALAAGFVASCIVEPRRSLDRLVDSASEICEQHLTMVEHLKELPPEDVVAVGDAGAFTYLTDHRTYDLVGLTTPGAAEPFAAGQGSVFERLEHVAPSRRPRWFAYYPTWFGQLPMGGRLRARVRLRNSNHVGGAVVQLRPVRTELFGSGARPRIAHPQGHLSDELDVADLESERAHDYELPGTARHLDFMQAHPVDGQPVADGGRLQRGPESFVLHAEPGRAATWIFRVDRRHDCSFELSWNGRSLPEQEVTRARGFAELQVSIPADRVRAENRVHRRCRDPEDRGVGVGVYHDWLYQ